MLTTNLPADFSELEEDKVTLFALRESTPAVRLGDKARGHGANGFDGFELALTHPPSDDAEVGHNLNISVRSSSPTVIDRDHGIYYLEEIILYGAIGQPHNQLGRRAPQRLAKALGVDEGRPGSGERYRR